MRGEQTSSLAPCPKVEGLGILGVKSRWWYGGYRRKVIGGRKENVCIRVDTVHETHVQKIATFT